MADIFISYDQDDVVRARGLAEALTALGWEVWWDDAIRAGSPFDLVIDEQLDAASSVIVMWSTASVTSSWVRAEASAADEQGKLLPITFERNLRLPVRFRQLNVAYLTSTDPMDLTSNAVGFLSDIATLTNRQPLGVDRAMLENQSRRSSGARLVTAGSWRITCRKLFFRTPYDLRLHPNGIVSGTAGHATLAGRWMFDPAEQVLHLDLSTSEGMAPVPVPVKIIAWETADVAKVKFQKHDSRLERVAVTLPASTDGSRDKGGLGGYIWVQGQNIGRGVRRVGVERRSAGCPLGVE